MNDTLKNKLKNAPKTFGCYIWKNKYNEIIYVGKAKNIFKRTHQYFLRPNDNKTAKLVQEISDVDFIVVKNENEALILESNLIKKYKPKYNILLKNNNGYPYFLVTNESKPRFLYVHNYDPKKGKYYGPFANSNMKAYEIYNLLLKLFPLRKCNSVKNKKCFYYDLNMCMGACLNEDTKEKYDLVKAKIDNFFTKGNNEIINELKKKELDAVKRLDFEQANNYLDLQKAIKLFSENQIINLNSKNNIDVVGFAIKENYISIIIFSYLNGKLLNKNLLISKYVGDIDDEVASYLYQYYSVNLKPSKLYVSLNQQTINLLKKNLNITIFNPGKGKIQEILETAIKNANLELNFKLNSLILKENRNILANQELAEKLNIKELNRIEIFDNSNIFNVDKVAAMVVYENGIPNKKEYRKYKIQNLKAKSDYEYMYEIIYRRFLRLLKEKKKFPDLIVVDGGKIQINAALKALKELFIADKINLIGLVKDNKHKTDYIQLSNNTKIHLDKKSNLYFYLFNMQEEVHKFAITYFRKTNQKSAISSILDNIKNLGKIRKEKLLSIFGNITNIKNATIEELMQIIPKNVAIEIQNKLKNEVLKND
ncbi:excinuclease ABC subunit UvrC [Mycoplasmoides pirum]|uniref:excinuclease ABC subunit UvrC n=1 Tax=Mycoplasmoides pirum TaxID=2122 RepID=UPI0004884297|nr:excinuclease ABC subunit UvrC [Mycoplasmoides pirum]